MSGVDFCDSTGMNVLLAAQRMAREQGGNVELSGPRPAVRKILAGDRVESVFTVVENRPRPGQNGPGSAPHPLDRRLGSSYAAER